MTRCVELLHPHATEAEARDIGELHLEGQEYLVADGDVTHLRFAT